MATFEQIQRQATGLDVTIDRDLDLSVVLDFTDAASVAYPVTAADVAVDIGGVTATVVQVSASSVRVSTTAASMADLSAAVPWVVTLSGAPILRGTFRRTTSPTANPDDGTVTVVVSDDAAVVTVTISDGAAIAAVQADLDAHEAVTTGVHGITDTASLLTRAGISATAFRVVIGTATEDYRNTGIRTPVVTMSGADLQRVTAVLIHGKDFPAGWGGQTVDVQLQWAHSEVSPAGNFDFTLRTRFYDPSSGSLSGTPTAYPLVSVDTSIAAANQVSLTTLASGVTVPEGRDLVIAVDRSETDTATFAAYLVGVRLDLA